MRLRKLAPAVGAFAAGAILAGALATMASAEESAAPAPAGDRVCVTEDSIVCLWDARTQGDRRGTPIYRDARGRTYFLALSPKAFAAVKRSEGWTYWDAYDGHMDCWAHVADTSVIHCRDGFVTTS